MENGDRVRCIWLAAMGVFGSTLVGSGALAPHANPVALIIASAMLALAVGLALAAIAPWDRRP